MFLYIHVHASERTKLFFPTVLDHFLIFAIVILFLKRKISTIDSLAREKRGNRSAYRREPVSSNGAFARPFPLLTARAPCARWAIPSAIVGDCAYSLNVYISLTIASSGKW